MPPKTKRSRSPAAATALSTASPSAPSASSGSTLCLSPAELWASTSIAAWGPFLPPLRPAADGNQVTKEEVGGNTGGILFQRALEVFRCKMKKPSADILFEVDAKDTPYFSESDFPCLFPNASAASSSPSSSSSTPIESTIHARVVALMHRKLTRGQFRPGLLQKVESNSAKAVYEAVSASFAVAHAEMKKAQQPAAGAATTLAKVIKPLIALVGVGPATASLIASRFILCPTATTSPPAHGAWPFMSDEACAAVLEVPAAKLKYTAAELSSMTERLWAKRDALLLPLPSASAATAADLPYASSPCSALVTPDALGHALWAATVLSKAK